MCFLATALRADALDFKGNIYVGPTAGPLHLPNGAGQVLLADGATADAMFVDGRMHGVGTSRHKDGSVYIGNYVKGLPHGVGTYTWNNGDVYEGEWKAGKQEGTGRHTFADRRTFEGRVNGQSEGLGIMWSKGGKIINCGAWHGEEFLQSKPVPCRFLRADSKYLTAAMKAAGEDILLTPDGGFFTGATNAAFQRHGKGVMRSAEGAVLQRGVWLEDELICELPKETAGTPVAAAAPISAAGGAAAPTPHTTRSRVPSSSVAAAAAFSSAAAVSATPATRVFATPSTDCVVCANRPRDCLIDCVHFVLCFRCAQNRQSCPICRAAITYRTQRKIVLS